MVDPAMSGLASSDVVRETRTSTGGGSVQGIGSVTYTVSKVQTAGTSGYARITGCADLSKLVQVRKDGSHYVGANTKKYPTLKMTAETNPGITGPVVTSFTYAVGTC
jgi:hypothetical protein